MKELLRYYNDELVFFSQMARLYAQKYPKTAARLLKGGDTSEDPHIDRMIQSFALLTARVAQRLDSDYSRFTESMLESVYPHYLRPIPSYSIVQFGSPDKPAQCDTVRTFARATMLQSEAVQGVPCRFRTVYDVTLAPVIVTKAAFSAFTQGSRSVALPTGATGTIAICIESTSNAFQFNDCQLTSLRVLVDGERSLCAALMDALFIRTVAAFVQMVNDATWMPLNRVPLRLAGLGEADALIPFTARSHPAFRLLTEYFAYPDKFSFVDIDLTEFADRLPANCRRFTLHLALTGTVNHSAAAHLLASLSAQNFLSGCTPVINLFKRSGVPL